MQPLKFALDNSSNKGLLGPLREPILRLPVARFAMSILIHHQDQMGLLAEVNRPLLTGSSMDISFHRQEDRHEQRE